MLSPEIKNMVSELVKKVRENPELSGEEFFACSLQVDFLKKQGFTVKSPIAGEKTAYKAVFTVNGKEGEYIPSFAFCAEYDALPEVKHGCGHPLIMGSSLTAALSLKNMLEEKNIPGKIILFGCPAEETYGGKYKIADSTEADEADAFLMAHPIGGESFLEDIAYSGLKGVRIIYSGTGGSGAARMANPAFVNPLDAQNLLYQAVALRRHFFPRDVAITGVITDGGTRSNMLPLTTESSYTVRSQDPSRLEEYTEILCQMAEGAAMMTGTKIEIIRNRGLVPTRPNRVLNRAFLDAVEKHGGRANCVMPQRGGCFAGTDFGIFSQRKPGCHLHFPIMKKAAAHTKEFHCFSGEKEALESMFTAGECMAESAWKFITEKSFRQQVEEDFRKADCFEE